jgi:hypothetical protein
MKPGGRGTADLLQMDMPAKNTTVWQVKSPRRNVPRTELQILEDYKQSVAIFFIKSILVESAWQDFCQANSFFWSQIS